MRWIQYVSIISYNSSSRETGERITIVCGTPREILFWLDTGFMLGSLKNYRKLFHFYPHLTIFNLSCLQERYALGKDAFCTGDWRGSKWREKIPGRGEIMGRRVCFPSPGENRTQSTTNNTSTDNIYVPVLQLKLQIQVWCPLNPMKV